MTLDVRSCPITRKPGGATPVGWKRVLLTDAARLESGHTPSRRVSAYWEGGDVAWLSLKDIRGLNGKFVHQTADQPTMLGIDNSSARLLPSGTVALCRTASVGNVAILGREMATSQDFVNWVCGKELLPEYLYWAIRSSKPTFDAEKQGSTHQTIYMPILMQFRVLLPPLAEQKRIAGILDAADALLAKRRETLAQLDILLKATFLDLFGDPVTNPKGFPVRELSEFYVNDRDGTKCGPFGSALKKDEFVESGVPVWNMDNINLSGRMVLPFRSWITSAKYEALKSYAVLNGDVLISRAGTVGKMCVARSDSPRSIISTNLIRVRFGTGLLPIHFVSLMTFCKGRVGRLKVGPDGAFTHMSTGVLDNLAFPYPPIEVQRRFNRVAESIEKQKEVHRTHLAELDTLFASLQHRAFRGEL